MPPRTSHSSDDRHQQPSISARIDQSDFDRLETHCKRVKVPRRRIIIRALLEFLDRNEHSGNEEENPR